MVKEVKQKKAERGDKIRNRAKVLKEIIKDPTQSQRDIAKKIGVSKSAVTGHMKDIPKSPKVAHIEKVIENDAKIVELGQKILLQRMEIAEEDPTAMSARDIISATDLSAKRGMILNGDATKSDGGFKIDGLSKEELLRIAMGK